MSSTKELPGVSDLLATVKSLPPLPGGVSNLLKLSHGDPGYFEKASEIIRSDPAMVTQILKVANSARYSGEGPVDTLDRAVMRVGIKMVVAELTTSHLTRTFTPKHECLGELWLLNILGGAICRTLAERTPSLGLPPETAYTYGLLHDVGRFVMVLLYPESMSELLAEDPHMVYDLARREEEVFGFNHCTVGRLVGNRWRFPQELTLIMGGHHMSAHRRSQHPERVDRLMDLIILCDHLITCLRRAEGSGLPEDEVRGLMEEESVAAVVERLGVEPREVQEAVRPALVQIERHADALGIPVEGRLPKVEG